MLSRYRTGLAQFVERRRARIIPILETAIEKYDNRMNTLILKLKGRYCDMPWSNNDYVVLDDKRARIGRHHSGRCTHRPIKIVREDRNRALRNAGRVLLAANFA